MITFLLSHLELQKEFASTYYTPCNSPMKKNEEKKRRESKEEVHRGIRSKLSYRSMDPGGRFECLRKPRNR